jgi:putative glutamine amidotransferase
MMGKKPVIGLTSTILETSTIENKDQTIPTIAVYNKFAETVREAGGIPIVIPMGDAKEAFAYVDFCDGIIFTGGEDISALTYGHKPHPEVKQVNKHRDDFEMELVQVAHKEKKAILGMCRGYHMINVSFGGSIIQDVKSDFSDSINHFQLSSTRTEPSHMVSIEKDSLLYEIIGEHDVAVNSFHHQAIGDVGKGLRVTAKAEDGVIEALELEERDGSFLLGTQWHPEELRHENENMMNIIKTFIKEAGKSKSK